MSISVVFHKNYNATIGDDHKFPINKFSELAAYLEKKILLRNSSNHTRVLMKL